MRKSRQLNLNTICRTCLSKGELKSLYDQRPNELTLAEMLMSCTSIQYYGNDGLPPNMCLDCVSEIRRSYKFSLKCQDSDDRLQTYLQTLHKAKQIDIFKYATKASEILSNNIDSNPHSPQMSIKYESDIEDPLQDSLSVDELDNEMDTQVDVYENKIDKNYPKPAISSEQDLEMTLTENINKNLKALFEYNNETSTKSLNPKLDSIKTEIHYEEDYSLPIPTISGIRNVNNLSNDPVNSSADVELNQINGSTILVPTTNIHLEKSNIQLPPQIQNSIKTKSKNYCIPINNLIPVVCLKRLNLNVLTNNQVSLNKIATQLVNTKKSLEFRETDDEDSESFYSGSDCEQSDGDESINVDCRTKNQSQNAHTDEKIQQTEILNTSNEAKLPYKQTTEQSSMEVANSVAESMTVVNDISESLDAATTSKHYELRKRTCTKRYTGFTDEDFSSDPNYTDSESSSNEDSDNDEPHQKSVSVARSKISKPVEFKKHLKCSKCDRTFYTANDYEEHLKTHSTIPYTCPNCAEPCETIIVLRNHKYMHFPSCAHCRIIFVSNNDLKNHVQQYHTDKLYCCTLCEKIFATESSLANHMPVHVNVMQYTCTVCGEKYQENKSYEEHMLKHSNGAELNNKTNQINPTIAPSNIHHNKQCESQTKPSSTNEELSKNKPPISDPIKLAHFINDKMKLLIHKDRVDQSNTLNHQTQTEPPITNLSEPFQINQLNELENNPQSENLIDITQQQEENSHLNVDKSSNVMESELCQNPIEQIVEKLDVINSVPSIIEIDQSIINNDQNGMLSNDAIIIDDSIVENNQTSNESSNIVVSDLSKNQNEQTIEKCNIINAVPSTISFVELIITQKPSNNVIIINNAVVANNQFIRLTPNAIFCPQPLGGVPIPKLFSCPKCDRKFDQIKNVTKHMRVHPEVKQYKCEKCDALFGTAIYLQRHHLRTHPTNVKRMYACPVCKKKYTTQSYLKDHMGLHEKEPKNSCKFCPRKFHLKKSMHIHMRKHNDVRFICTVCGKKFSSARHYNCHFATHLDKKPLSCTKCAIEFKTIYKLNAHVKLVHPTIITCFVCHLSFKNKALLKIHMETHQDSKPFKCSLCTHAFWKSGSLKQHQLTHSDERPYLCTVCNKSFKTKTNINKHKLTHKNRLFIHQSFASTQSYISYCNKASDK